MQELGRCRLNEQIVVIGGTPKERSGSGYRVADFEANALNEEPLTGLEVDGAEHDVAEFAGLDWILSRNGLGAGGATVGSARRVLGNRGNRARVDRVGNSDDDLHSGTRVDGFNRSCRLRHGDPDRGYARRDRVEIVGIADTETERHEASPRRCDESELFASVDAGEPIVIEGGQAELFVVGARLGDVWDTDAD